MTAGRKWAATVAMALVFGVVAGGTMYGVNRAADYFDGDDNTVVQTTQPLAQTDTSVGGSDSETVSAQRGSGRNRKRGGKKRHALLSDDFNHVCRRNAEFLRRHPSSMKWRAREQE